MPGIRFPILISVFVGSLYAVGPASNQTCAQEKEKKVDNARSLWDTHVADLLKANCTKCHNDSKKSGLLNLTSVAAIFKGGKKGPAVKPGDASQSLLYQLVQKGAKPHMPPGKNQLGEEEIVILRRWIERLEESKVSETRTSPKPQTADKLALLPAGMNPTTVIDFYLQKKWASSRIPVAGRSSDDEFIRRVYLDLIGRIPSVDELNQFRSQTDSDKRPQLVDKLLASREHAEFFAKVFDTLFMGRGKDSKYGQRQSSGWNDFLIAAFKENRPWNQVVRDILLARPENKTQRGAPWFLFERNNKHQQIAEAIAPAVFGIRIECAQCHDHPLAGEIEQRHYWGLVAFYRRGNNVNTKNGPRVSESAIGGFEDFSDLSGQAHPNELIFYGKEKVSDVRPKPGMKEKDDDKFYQAASIPNEPRIPNFSRRQKFVDQVLKDHPLVAKAMVNRLWALLMGRGLVHPFDKIDSAHPPSHPELFAWLARDFEQGNYDSRKLIRAIVLSQGYQLRSSKPAKDSDPAHFSWSLEKPLVAEAWTGSISQLLRKETKDRALIKDFRKIFGEVLPEENISKLSQTMFLSNSPSLNEFIRQSHADDHLHTRLMRMPDHVARVQHVYQAAYSRLPDEEELTRNVEFLTQRQDRLGQALDLMLWAIVTSSEFRINH